MANYFLNDDGSLTKSSKKKKKGNNYILQDDGKIVLEKSDFNSISTDTTKEDLMKRRDELDEQIFSYDRKLKREWWDKDDGFLDNAGNVLYKLFAERQDDKYVKDEKYDALVNEYKSVKDKLENKIIEDKKAKGIGTLDKIAYTITGNVETAARGIESTATKILGGTPEVADLSFNEKMAQTSRQETSGIGGVGLDVVGSVSRMLPNMLVGNPTGAMAMGFANYGGGAYNEAKRDGATEEQATKYGLVVGTLEMALEKALGGFESVYGKSLAGNFTNRVMGKLISNPALRKAASGMAGEFTEEYLQEFLEPIVKNTILEEENGADFWNTMKDDFGEGLKQLGGQFFNKENAYAGMLGAVTSGVVGAPSNFDAYNYTKKTGRDIDTGLTTNEQSVLDTVKEQRTTEIQKERALNTEIDKQIKEFESTFGTMTEAEKNGIKTRIQEKLDKGEIDYTSSKLSKKEIAKIKKEVRTDLEKGNIDIDTIESTLASEKTAQIKELEARLNESTNEQEKAEIQAQISELTNAKNTELKALLSKDTYLQNSYREANLKKEKFFYEPTGYESEYKRSLAKDFEKVANNTTKSHETFEMLSKIAEDKQTNYGVINNEQLKQLGYDVEGKDVNGLVRVNADGTQKVLINIDSNKALNRIVGHETTHLLEGTQEYAELQQVVKEYAETKGDYSRIHKELTKLYDGIDADIDAEITSELVGDYLFTDTDFINNLSTKKPTIFQKIYNEIKHLYKMATAGSKEARQLEKVKKAFDKAYKQNASNMEVDSTKYSLTDNQGRTLTKEQQEYFKDSKVRDENGDLLEVYHGTNVDFNVFNYDNFGVNGNRYGTGFYFTDDIKEAEHFTNNETIKKVYLNIKKPLNAYGKKMSYSKFSKILNSLNEYGRNNIDNYNNEEIFGTNENAQKFGHQDNISKSIYDFYNNSNSNAELMEAMFIYSNKMGLDIPTSLNIFEKATGNDGMVGEMDNGKKIYVTFNSNQIKNIDNTNPTSDADIRYSLGNEDIAPSRNDVFGSDIKLQVEEAIAPLKEEIAQLKEVLDPDYESTIDYSPLTEEELPYLEQQYEEDFKNIDESYAPIKQEDTTPEAEDEITATKSLEDVRDFDEVGSRKVKAYQYENPEVMPYFQEMARYMLGDLENSVKGERGYNDQLYYDTAGEQGFYGTTRQTTDDIAELLDSKYNYSYKDIRKGLEAIIEDHGAENIAVAKRIELALDKRLREGYTDVSGYEIPANEEYLKLMEAKEIDDYYNNLPIDESMIPPEEDIAPVVNISNTQVTENIAPIRRNVDWDSVEDTSQGNQIAFNDEGETVEIVNELEKKQQRAYKKLGTKEDYISNKSFELYNEVKDLKKGKRASYELGRVLDVAFANINALTEGMTETEAKEVKNTIWRDVTTSLLNVKAKPLSTVNKNSTIEAVIRQNINREYDSKKNEIANMKEEDLVTKTKKELRKELLIDENDFFINALDNAKNRSMALMNNTDTIRNTELVFGRENGRKINEIIFQKEIDNEADSIAWQNKERDEIKALGIKARSKESAAVQKYGEKQYVETNGELVSYTDEDLVREFPNVETQEKIKKAAKVIRNKYDNYIDRANEVLTKLGFDAIPKRKDYMRHFQELNDVFSRYGIPFNAQSMTEHVLPTDINGLTENWSPQKNYFANTQRRTGLKTTYDAITGVDGYIGGIANLIYHTEDIQRGRAFEELIRETYGEDKGFENLDNLPEELQQARAEKIQDNHLSNYAAWLHEWTNNVAGKKHKIDRSVESLFGRKAFSFLDGARKQVGSNMIGFNLSSSLTNLIAPVQATAKTNKLAVLKGTADTIKNMFVKDDFMSKNKFLTARMGTDMISKNAWQKMQDAGFIFMKGMDWFSSNQIVRSKFYELRAKGMSEQQAHAEAGQFAARILGDRTKGANAQLYNSKLVGLVTQFQLEVNNQLYSQFYDTYHESKENAKGNALKTAAGMTFTLGQLFAFTHLFGQTFEAIAGYNPTFDIIDMIKTALGWGEDDDEEKITSERLKDAADQLVDALPYVNILTGGGRIPVASGLPNLVGVATGGKDQYGNELTLEDELKKLLFLIPPTGGNQFKKTTQGLSMFDEDLPISGSYTDSGNLRFPVEDTIQNRIQASLFGQYASENAGYYFDNDLAPLKEKQIEEFIEMDIPYKEYREYRKELSKVNKTKADKDEAGKPISGTAAGKKAYQIMNGNYSKKEKERLLEGLSSETYRITTSDLNKLNNNEELYKYYFSLSTKGKSDFINAIKNYGFNAETLYEANTTIKNIEDNYSKLNDNGRNLTKQKKETIKNAINQYTTTKAQYDYLYHKIYKK